MGIVNEGGMVIGGGREGGGGRHFGWRRRRGWVVVMEKGEERSWSDDARSEGTVGVEVVKRGGKE